CSLSTINCAPPTGCVRSSCCNNASAGGQLEQPSEVNSSTRTGAGASPCGASEADTNSEARIIANIEADSLVIPYTHSALREVSHAGGGDVRSRKKLQEAPSPATWGQPPTAVWASNARRRCSSAFARLRRISWCELSSPELKTAELSSAGQPRAAVPTWSLA